MVNMAAQTQPRPRGRAQFPARESNRVRAARRVRSRGTSPVGTLMQHWRRERRMSQLALAGEAGVTQRHVSFVESGRAHPSREMVLTLARALDVPLRERNQLLLAAGYAPQYRETGLGDAAMATVSDALSGCSRQHEPLPRGDHGPPLGRRSTPTRRPRAVRVPARRRRPRAGQRRPPDVRRGCGRTSRTSSSPARR